MDHCFLFTNYLNDEGCLCLKLSETGALIAPPAQLSFTEIKKLQHECTTVVVETSSSASILELELPWLPERKARNAIPFALEDKLAQPLEELYFFFDKLRYYNNHYLIFVLSKQRINSIIKLLQTQSIHFNLLTLDWFALAPEQSCVSDEFLLIHHDQFKGTLTDELALTYLKKHPLYEPLLFEDSKLSIPSLTKNKETSFEWMAQRLLRSRPMNLLQGELFQGNRTKGLKNAYLLAGSLCAFWLVSLLVIQGLSVYFLNKKISGLDAETAIIYHQFFPEAKQVIHPKFRISQLLGDQNSGNASRFWYLLNQFAQAVKENKTQVDELRYQNKTLFITLTSSDFASLEQLGNRLKKLQLKVKTTQAATRNQKVIATLELM